MPKREATVRLEEALLLSVETTEIIGNTDIEELKQKIDFKLLKEKTLKLVRLIYAFDALEIKAIATQQFNLSQTELLQFKMTQAEIYHQLETRAIARRSVVKPIL